MPRIAESQSCDIPCDRSSALACYPLAPSAAEAIPARLTAHAVLPAQTLSFPAYDAPRSLIVSGRFAGGSPLRVDALGSIEGSSPQAPEEAPRRTGIFLPIVGQPVQGFSGIRSIGEGEFLVLTDNGFGSRANSPNSLLMFHRVGRIGRPGG